MQQRAQDCCNSQYATPPLDQVIYKMLPLLINFTPLDPRPGKRKSGRKRSNTTVADYQYLAVPTLHNDVATSEFSRLVNIVIFLPSDLKLCSNSGASIFKFFTVFERFKFVCSSSLSSFLFLLLNKDVLGKWWRGRNCALLLFPYKDQKTCLPGVNIKCSYLKQLTFRFLNLYSKETK